MESKALPMFRFSINGHGTFINIVCDEEDVDMIISSLKLWKKQRKRREIRSNHFPASAPSPI